MRRKPPCGAGKSSSCAGSASAGRRRKRASHIHCPIPGTPGRRPVLALGRNKKALDLHLRRRRHHQARSRGRRPRFPRRDGSDRRFSRARASAGASPPRKEEGRPAVEEDETDEDREAALKRKRERAFELWTEAQAIPGTLGQVYFEQHRGIVVDWAAVHRRGALPSETVVLGARGALSRDPVSRLRLSRRRNHDGSPPLSRRRRRQGQDRKARKRPTAISRAAASGSESRSRAAISSRRRGLRTRSSASWPTAPSSFPPSAPPI